jgi:hypothetical protein
MEISPRTTPAHGPPKTRFSGETSYYKGVNIRKRYLIGLLILMRRLLLSGTWLGVAPRMDIKKTYA